MATKSILKNVNIKGRKQTKQFVAALEHAQEHKGKAVAMTRMINEIKGDKVKAFFSECL